MEEAFAPLLDGPQGAADVAQVLRLARLAALFDQALDRRRQRLWTACYLAVLLSASAFVTLTAILD